MPNSRRPWDLPERLATPEQLVFNRRALLVGGEPVADARLAAVPVDRVEAGHADDALVQRHRQLHAAVLVVLAARGADEGERVDHPARLSDEGHPGS